MEQEGKILFTPDNKIACFNTGLVTSNLEDIIALFEKYRRARPSFTTPYYFKSFIKESDRNLLRYFSSNMTEIADYFDKPELLIINPRCNVIPDIDHIIQDNKSRFPSHLQGASDTELRRHLIGAIDEVKKKVKACGFNLM